MGTLGGGGLSGGGSFYNLQYVQITNPLNNQALIYDAASGNWINTNSAPGTAYLAGLGDVTLTAPVANDFLVYNGTKWVNLHPAAAQVAMGLGSMATQNANAVAITGGTISGLASPLAIASGGTGQITKTAAFDGLAPTTTKGDLIAFNGTNNVRVAVGTDGYVLKADSTAPAGVSWVLNPTGAYDTVENAGVALTQRNILNFSGSGITAVDNAGATRTDVALAATLVDVAGLTPTANSFITGNGTHFVDTVITQGNTVYVALNGSDINGNGSIEFPYATIAKANSVITTASNTNKYVVALLGGRFNEAANILLKPYVAYVGYGSSFTYITSPNNIIAPDPSYNNANGRTSLVNIYVGGSTGITFDLSTLGTTGSCVLDLQNVQMNGGLTFIGRNLGADFVQSENSYWLGATTVSNAQMQFTGGFCASTVTVNTASTTGNSSGNFLNFGFGGAVTITSSGTHTTTLTIQNSPVGTNTMSITGGATTSVEIDAVSLPNLKSNLTITGATVTYLTDAYGVHYTPGTAGNWNAAPADVATALDDLASSGIYKSQTANTVLAAPSGSAGLPSFRALNSTDIPSIEFADYRYVDFQNGSDVTGDGSELKPWKSLQHSFNSIAPTINTPFVLVMAPYYDNADTGAITAKPNVVLMGIAPGAFVPWDITVTGGATNDTFNMMNFTHNGNFNWIRNDATNISLYLWNYSSFNTVTFEQQGAGLGGSLMVAYNCSFNSITCTAIQASIYGSDFYGTITYNDSGAATFQMFGGHSSGHYSFSGGITAEISGTFVESGVTLTTATTGSGTPAIKTDASSIPSSIVGPGVITSIAQAKYVNSNYTPVHYTATSNDVAGNLHGIDNALAAFDPFSVQVITANTTLAPNTGYIVNGVGQLTLTLPASFPVGSIIKIAGYAGGYTIVYGAGQNIIFGNQGTTIGTGSMTSTSVHDCVEIWAVAANLTFLVVDSTGQFTLV